MPNHTFADFVQRTGSVHWLAQRLLNKQKKMTSSPYKRVILLAADLNVKIGHSCQQVGQNDETGGAMESSINTFGEEERHLPYIRPKKTVPPRICPWSSSPPPPRFSDRIPVLAHLPSLRSEGFGEVYLVLQLSHRHLPPSWTRGPRHRTVPNPTYESPTCSSI